MTSGIRQEMDSPALSCNIYKTSLLRQVSVLRVDVWSAARVLLLGLNSPNLSVWTLIRLAVSHSLEISYAVWARLYRRVIFGELIMGCRLFSPLCYEWAEVWVFCVNPVQHVLALEQPSLISRHRSSTYCSNLLFQWKTVTHGQRLNACRQTGFLTIQEVTLTLTELRSIYMD